VTDVAGALVRFDGPSQNVAWVSVGGGRIVATTVDGSFVMSDRPEKEAPARTWRAPPVAALELRGRPIAAVSHDGTRLAVVRGGPEIPTLDLRLLDIATAHVTTHRVDLNANGAIAWIDATTLAVEVLGHDGQSTIATVDGTTGRAKLRTANGLSVSVSADGRRLAAIEVVTARAGVHDATAWLDGAVGADPPLPVPAGSIAETVALSPAGTRVAVVASDPAGQRSLILAASIDGRWQQVASVALPGPGPVSIAWLD
jgi:hypothetical protein